MTIIKNDSNVWKILNFSDLSDPYGTLPNDVYGADVTTLPRDMTLEGGAALDYRYDTSSIPGPSISPTPRAPTSGPSDVNF